MAAPKFSSPIRAGRAVELARGIRVDWALKMGATTTMMAAFFWAYFRLLNHPVFPVTTMPLLAIDRWLDYRAAALPLYFSLWCYVALAPALLTNRRELRSFGVASLALGVTGLGIFLCWPTTVPAELAAGVKGGWLSGVDAAGNACPSLHVAYAMFTAIWLERILRRAELGSAWRWANALWGAGVIYSTLAVKQHVALDVLAGMALGSAFAAAHLAWVDARPADRLATVSAATRTRE